MALKCKQHAEKAKTQWNDTEERKKANSLWRNYEQFHKCGAMMNDFVFELEGHANHPPEYKVMTLMFTVRRRVQSDLVP